MDVTSRSGFLSYERCVFIMSERAGSVSGVRSFFGEGKGKGEMVGG